MHELTLDTPLSTNFIPPFPTIPIAGSQADFSWTHAVIPTDGSDSDWSMPPPVEGLVAAGDTHEPPHGNNGSHVSGLEGAMSDFPAGPFAVPAPSCGLVGGLHCVLPLEDSVQSIKLHLRMHGHRHAQRQVVQCPWMGCSDTLKWMNIPRHIQSIHLGVRFRCSNRSKPYTRPEGLARHTVSLKCYGATHGGE